MGPAEGGPPGKLPTSSAASSRGNLPASPDPQSADLRPTTQQRVLDTSAELFNRYGIEAVSVGQIAEALKISPGNLTYHYKKKSDLIAAHLANFDHALQQRVREMPVLAEPRTFSAGWLDLVTLTFGYRFLFVGANYILQNDLLPPGRYAKLIETTKANFVRAIQRLVAKGFMQPIQAPYTTEMLVDSIWWQWLGSLLSMQVSPPAATVSERRLLADAVHHILFVAHHYIDQGFFREVQRELQRLGREPPAAAPVRRARAAPRKS